MAMELDDFVALVIRMRCAQRRYFRTKTRELLGEAMRLEMEVDNITAEHVSQLRFWPTENHAYSKESHRG